ncbi:hypothetical protein [Streptomyces sp. NPDC054838]
MTQDDAGGTAGPEFTRMARRPRRRNDAMFTECEHMAPAERRHAANTALDTLADFISIDA